MTAMMKTKSTSKKKSDDPRPVLLVTGLSGAGLSTALKALEDMGYQAVDNLPLSLLPALLSQKEGRARPVAVGIDSRTWDFSAAKLAEAAEKLRGNKLLAVSLLFIECQSAVLQRRFTETRRVHPLAVDRPVADGVARDRELMEPLRHAADLILDTTDMLARDMRRWLAGHYPLERAHGLLVFVTSFGFKHGLPRDADLVFDARFLDNPHWHAKLRPLSGRDKPVADHILKDKGYGVFYARLTDLLAVALPRYQQDGRSYLTLAIGCTGGRHRSVFIAEELFKWVDAQGFSVSLHHRDIDLHVAHSDAPKTKRKKV